MLKLNFEVDPRYLIYYALVNCSANSFINDADPNLVAFQNLAWERDQQAYSFLRNDMMGSIMGNESLANMGERAEKLLSSLAKEPLFNTLHEETLDSMYKTKLEWENDFERSSSIMQELTGFEFNMEFRVVFSHPSQTNGRGGLTIQWSYRNDFPHYNTVYLWHEIMHTYLPAHSHDVVVNLEHAVIELLTDEELRKRFNGGEYPPFVGHQALSSMKEKLLPNWSAYLVRPQKNIREFLALAADCV